MEHDKKHPLVPRPGTDITTPGRRTSRVMAVVTGDILARARTQDLGAARFAIGEYLLREPDYRQILRWAEAAGLAPEVVLERLAESSVEPVEGYMEPIAHSTPFGHLFHRHPAGDSTGIRPPVPRPFGRGSRSEATQVGHCYSAGTLGVNVRAWRLRIDSPLRVIR
jgi:hypothetical protein